MGKNLFDELSNEELLIISIVGSSGKIKPTRLQKVSLLAKAITEGRVPPTHNPYYFGGFSDEIEEDSEQLREEGFLKYHPREGFILSDEGQRIKDEFTRKNPELVERLDKVIKLLSKLDDEEVVALTYALFPKLAEKSIIKGKIAKIQESHITIDQLRELIENSK